MTAAKPATVIGVDLGGTKVASGLIEGQSIIARDERPVSADRPADVVLEEVISSIRAVWRHDVQALGIGVPSVVDITQGIVYDVQNIPSWKEIHLRQKLEDLFDVPVRLDNDANCFALGEKYFGRGKDYQNFVGLIMGTGFAAGIIIDGQLYHGKHCGAGEFGEVPYLDKNFEQYCSGQYFKHTHQVTARKAHESALAGDRSALAIFHVFGRHVGSAVMAILLCFDPECIILGGSVSSAFPFFENAMRNRLQTFPYRKTLDDLNIMVSEQPDIALLGAGALPISLDLLTSHPHSERI